MLRNDIGFNSDNIYAFSPQELYGALKNWLDCIIENPVLSNY